MLGLLDQYDDLAAGRRAAIVQLQVFALVLIAGGRAVARGEGEAIHANSDVLRRATYRRTYASGKKQMKMIAAENRVDVFRRIAKAMLKSAVGGTPV